jgi:CheY-like chemotaxis protein
MSTFVQISPDSWGMLPMWERKMVRMLSEKAAVPGPAKGLLLCIDDALPVLEILTGFLEKYGYSVLASPDVKHGLTLFETTDVDIVILDHDMPEMNGHEVALAMKRIKPAVPIIMHSGAPEIPEKTLKVVDAVVPKGIDLQLLISEVTGIMAGSRNSPGKSL